MTRAPETRRVRPQAGASATPSDDAANGVPQRPVRGRPAAPQDSAPAPTATPQGRPVRGRAQAPVSAQANAPANAGGRRSAPAAAPVAPVAPLVVFAARSAAAKDAFFGPMGEVMTELHEVLHKEIAALDASETDKLDILRHRKDGLAKIYLEALVNLRRDETLKARLDEVDREALRQAGEAIRTATVENMRRLQARIDTVGDVINSVIEAARTGSDTALKVYEQDGKVGSGERATSRLGLDTAL